MIIFLIGIPHCGSHDKHKEWEYEVSGCATAPPGMKEGRVYMFPVPGIIHDHHKGDRQAPKNIKCNQSFGIFHENDYYYQQGIIFAVSFFNPKFWQKSYFYIHLSRFKTFQYQIKNITIAYNYKIFKL
jgi:hypothetical protein